MNIGGIHQSGANSAAAIVHDGVVCAALLEERLTRQKFDKYYPEKALVECLDLCGIALSDLRCLAVGWNPMVQLAARYRSGYSDWVPYGGQRLYSAIHKVASQTFGTNSPQTTITVDGESIQFRFVKHHLCHASTAFFYSPFDEAAYITCDGYGELDVLTWGIGRGKAIFEHGRQSFPHSIGQFYSTITDYLGFRPDMDEWKVMGAAAYGNAARYEKILEPLIQVDDHGQVQLDLGFFDFYNFEQSGFFSEKFSSVMDFPPRNCSDSLEQKHFDFAAAVQVITEKSLAKIVRAVLCNTGLKKVCLSGGTFLNSCFNGKIHELVPECEEVFIPFCPDDAGNAIGAALYTTMTLGGERPEKCDPFLGKKWTDVEIGQYLDACKIVKVFFPDIVDETVRRVMNGEIVGWFQGRMEFGPRALGNRSILADVRRPEMRDRINQAVKFREGFRPFALAVLHECAGDFFEGYQGEIVPFMERVYRVKEHRREEIPAVVHADGTVRIQTVRKEDNPLFHALLTCLATRSGIPMVLNTSFNLNDEPIVYTPADAIRSFYTSGLEALVLGNYLLTK
jgi:carbamoyltransferase